MWNLLVQLNISLWFVGVEESLLAPTFTDRDGGPLRTTVSTSEGEFQTRLRCVRSSTRNIGLFYLTHYDLKNSRPNKYPCWFLPDGRYFCIQVFMFGHLTSGVYKSNIITVPFSPSHLFTFSLCLLFPPLPLFMLSFPLSHPYKARLLFFRTRSCN